MTTNPTGQEALIERLRAMVSKDGRAITCNGRTTREMCADILAAAEALSSTPESKEQFAENANWSVPEGYVLVPREPTVEMLGAWWRQKNCGTQEVGGYDPFHMSDCDAYRAMLSSSPNKGEGGIPASSIAPPVQPR